MTVIFLTTLIRLKSHIINNDEDVLRAILSPTERRGRPSVITPEERRIVNSRLNLAAARGFSVYFECFLHTIGNFKEQCER